MAMCLISDAGRGVSQQDPRLSIYSLQKALGPVNPRLPGLHLDKTRNMTTQTFGAGRF